MALRNQGTDEAARWKAKFLDALEDSEKQQKQYQSRIRLLRRGLLGVSLAGDGLDSTLDGELNELRALLRAQDTESGIEILLDRIEKSVVRLDSQKEESSWAIARALESSTEQLQAAALSRSLKKQLRNYARALPAQLKDAGDLSEPITQFLELARAAVRELGQVPDSLAEKPGFLRRLFFGDDSATGSKPNQSQANETQSELPTAAKQQADREWIKRAADQSEPAQSQAATAVDVEAESAAGQQSLLQENSAIEPMPAASFPEASSSEAIAEAPKTPETTELPASEKEAEPGFSYIAGHAEPLLLRILENIYIAEQSLALAAEVRNQIGKGLNWYDFVAVLEDIAAIIASAIDQERTDFQDFLGEINASLGQVQQFVLANEAYRQRTRAAESKLDQQMRTQVGSLTETVSSSDNIQELKQAVQGQLQTLLATVDDFRADRAQDEEQLATETARLQTRIEDLEKESAELREHLQTQQQNASTDALTELPNRASYDRQIRALCRQAATTREEHSLVVCDVDLFKGINDNYGHLAGDKVLKLLARELASSLRSSDFVARYGGEEFVIILQSTPVSLAKEIMEKQRLAISQIPFHFKEQQVQITMSYGITGLLPQDTPDTLFERADKALYAAKKAGRNRIVQL
ncbi:MAG: diguanylate cyclase [Pseudomonadales bacterium]|nr:diguanylate cyclase [Pseudomonadales bacterium]